MDNSVSQIDLNTYKIRNTTKVGEHPFGITLSRKGDRIYSANVESNDISVLTPDHLKRLARIAVGARPYASA